MPSTPADSAVRNTSGPSRTRRIANVLLGVAVLSGVVAVASLYLRTAAESPHEIAAVQQGTLTHEIYATGTLNARVTVDVGSQLSGVVKRVAADHNQRVKHGQLLALLDTDRLQAELAQTEATLESTRALLERAKVEAEAADVSLRRTRELSAAGLVADSERDAAEARYRSAKAEAAAQERQVTRSEATVQLARVNLRHAAVTSPIDGVVLSRRIEVGETVNATPQTPTLFVIGSDLGNLQIDIDVAEGDVSRVVVGQHANFTVDGYPGQTFSGVVREARVGPHLKQQAVYYRVIAAVSNAALQLRPGMTADVWIQTARHENALLIPSTAVRETGGHPYVDVLAGVDVRKRVITTGLRGRDGRIEVLSGLAPGEQIVISPKQR